MNGPTHQIAGAIAGITISLLDTPEKSGHLRNPIIAGSIGAYLGRLPDMIEPALNNPHHRQFFHSIAILSLVAGGMYKVCQWKQKRSRKICTKFYLDR